MKLYGIPNCGTVKKARAWLDEHGVAYEFLDFKKQGITEAMLSGWLQASRLAETIEEDRPDLGTITRCGKSLDQG